MRFSEAVEAMKDGKSVRRSEWYPGSFWFKCNAPVYESHPRRVGWLRNPEVRWTDVVADDWEVYNPPAPRYIQMQLGDDVLEGYDGEYEIGEDGKLHPAVEYDAC